MLYSVYEGFDLSYDVEILKDYLSSHFGLELESSELGIVEKNLE